MPRWVHFLHRQRSSAKRLGAHQSGARPHSGQNCPQSFWFYRFLTAAGKSLCLFEQLRNAGKIFRRLKQTTDSESCKLLRISADRIG